MINFEGKANTSIPLARAIASTTTAGNPLLQQHEFKSVLDSTGSRFSVKLNDNRLIRVNLSEASTSKLVNMCLEAFKYALNKEIYYEIIQQWYIHRYTVGGESVRDQLNLFLYLILNLCGCFDISKLEKELPFLITNSNIASSSKLASEENATEMTHDTLDTSEHQQQSEEGLSEKSKLAKTKRTRGSNQEGNDSDWDFLLGDESLKGLSEFNVKQLKKSVSDADASEAASRMACEFQPPMSTNFQKAKLERVSFFFLTPIYR